MEMNNFMSLEKETLEILGEQQMFALKGGFVDTNETNNKKSCTAKNSGRNCEIVNNKGTCLLINDKSNASCSLINDSKSCRLIIEDPAPPEKPIDNN